MDQPEVEVSANKVPFSAALKMRGQLIMSCEDAVDVLCDGTVTTLDRCDTGSADLYKVQLQCGTKAVLLVASSGNCAAMLV